MARITVIVDRHETFLNFKYVQELKAHKTIIQTTE